MNFNLFLSLSQQTNKQKCKNQKVNSLQKRNEENNIVRRVSKDKPKSPKSLKSNAYQKFNNKIMTNSDKQNPQNHFKDISEVKQNPQTQKTEIRSSASGCISIINNWNWGGR
jgi:glycerol-3-phosphate cytidylyltransferase-like family protein